MKNLLIVFSFTLIANSGISQTRLQKYSLGNFKLENGETIQDCFITYQTHGKLNASKSNVIVLLTWFTGNSDDLVYLTHSGGWADSSKYFVVIIDAFGNGKSVSPSNSTKQPFSSFPKFSIRDMIQSQYRLLTEKIKLNHVFAVGGISMGGFQTFQWLISYPAFMDNVVVIEGTPQSNSYDKLFYQTNLNTIILGLGKKEIEEQSYRNGIDLLVLNGWTPDFFQREHKSTELQEFLKTTEAGYLTFNVYNWVYQMSAIEQQDIYQGKSLEEIAKAIKANVYIEVNKNDHIVNPNPSKEFAEFIKAKFLELNDDCGHLSFVCQQDLLNRSVTDFLKR